MDTFVILTARNEADRIETTLAALARAFPGAAVWVADDGSIDGTAGIARRAGARVVRSEHKIGKGAAATLAAREALAWLREDAWAKMIAAPATDVWSSDPHVAILCDGDLGESASLLARLADTVCDGHADLSVAVFARRVGGGLGLTVGFARWAIRRRCGLRLEAPISGQRAMCVKALEDALPFADGFGMEVGMTIDAVRAGYRVVEVELDLHHRATGPTIRGFVHRGRQLWDCGRAYLLRR